MTNGELNEKLKNLAAQERKLTQEIVQHIAEVDRRKLYLAMNYPNLFEYLTREIGYANGPAQLRIDAARLLQRPPEISEKLKTGAINLSQINKAQRHFRQLRKSGEIIAVSRQKEIIQRLEEKNGRQTDLILAQEFGTNIVYNKTQIQSDESVRADITFSKDEMEIIEQARAILSNKTGGALKDTIVEMARRVVQSSAAVAKKSTTAEVVNAPKAITPKIRKTILKRDQVCQFKDAVGKICGSSYYLEVDHIHPKWDGGSNDRSNLRALCRAHNQFRYQSSLR